MYNNNTGDVQQPYRGCTATIQGIYNNTGMYINNTGDVQQQYRGCTATIQGMYE
jgi:hypothetical protein